MKLLVINNLSSGLQDGSIYDYIRTLIQDGDEVTIRSTDGTTDLRTFLYDAEKFDLVVASGGDGTLATISYVLADTGIPILPFPAGTANLLSMNLVSPTEPHALVEMTRQFNTMDFDLGEIKLSDGSTVGFTLMAGAGYDALIMKDAEAGKKLLGPMAYFTSAFANTNPQVSHFKLNIDGTEVESYGVGVLLINFSKIQFDLSVVHQNEPRDGFFDVVVLRTKDAFGLIPAFLAVIRDKNGEYPARTDAVEVFRGSTIEVYADPPLMIQYDGEVSHMQTPFKARVMPKAARYVVSQECLNIYSEDEPSQ